ncbi:MAG: soluble lytic murein transglycosylase [Acidobacteriota bacterium]|jgi:soluble lytic murein transglycosylase|nr:soluble lytic murein transglycosylase [Acidobacteriota bacterium]
MLKTTRRCFLVSLSLFLFCHCAVVSAQTPRESYETVRAAVDGGDYRTALSELQGIQRADPSLFTRNNYDYLLARLADRLGETATAGSNYQTVVTRRSPLSQYALWHLADLARGTGDLTLERERLRQLITTSPTSLLRAAAVARRGESFFESKDYASAIATLSPRSSPAGDSSEREASALIGEAYVRSGQKDAARDAFAKLVSKVPNAAQPDDFALAGVRGLDVLDSVSEEAALKSAPQLSEEVHLLRARVYNFNRDFAGARRHYQAIVDRYAQSADVPEALYMIGRGFYQERNFADALTYFQRVVAEYPQSANARDALGFSATAYARLNRVDEAIAAYKGVIDHYGSGPNPERPFLNIIDILRDAGRDADALSWVEQTRTRFKGQMGATLALFSQARIHLSQGAWEAALADFDALKGEADLGGPTTNGSTNPREVAFMRAYVLEQLGRTEEAATAYLLIPDGRNEYYGGRSTMRLRGLLADPKSRSMIVARAEAFSAQAEKALTNRQFEEARRAAQSFLRLSDDADLRKDSLHMLQLTYAKLADYSLSAASLLSVGRQNVITDGEPNSNAQPTHQALSNELLFLGLYDEGAPELEASGKPPSGADIAAEQKSSASDQTGDKGNTASQTKPISGSPTSRDAAYTLAVLFKRGESASHAVRYAEPLWKTLPADYLLELAPREMVELLYPAPYRAPLMEYAPPRGVDPRFILSIMRQESRFRPEAKSNAAARGLLQFIASTSDSIAAQLGIKQFRQDDLYDPRIAILFGSQYMGNLFKQFPQMPQAVAASYNGGEDNVARWVARARSNDPDRYILEIGFAQSKDYVYKVLTNYWVYQTLYSEKLERR